MLRKPFLQAQEAWLTCGRRAALGRAVRACGTNLRNTGWIRAVVAGGTVAAIRLAGSTVAGINTKDGSAALGRAVRACGAEDARCLPRKTIVAASSAWGADGIGNDTAGRAFVENVHIIAPFICSCATHQHSSPAPQSAPPSAQHKPPDSHLAISTTQNRIKYVPLYPPANMAIPWFGSDVAARLPLATLRAAVVQRPLVPSKMSTALLQSPAHAQRISIHLQHLKARLLPRNTCPPDSHITPSCNINNSKHNNIRTACEYGQSLVRQ